MPETKHGNNMLLITSSFRGEKTFNLVPTTLNCPYVECLFDPQSKILAVITKTMKGTYHMVPKVDDNGDPQRLKIGKREGGKTIKEQRVMVDTFSEFYISDEKEIKDFMKTFTTNYSDFKFTEYFKKKTEEPKIITPGLTTV